MPNEKLLISRHLDSSTYFHLVALHLKANTHLYRLPFLLSLDCSLGIAMKHYLDELSGQPDPTALKTHEEIKDKGPKEWFPHAEDFRGDLDKAFMIWDAVSASNTVAVPFCLRILVGLCCDQGRSGARYCQGQGNVDADWRLGS